MSTTAAPVAAPAKPRSSASALVLLVLLGLLALTNPDKPKHDQAIQQTVKQRSPIASLFGAGRLASWAAEYHSVGIASYTTIDGQLATIGVFGIVVLK